MRTREGSSGTNTRFSRVSVSYSLSSTDHASGLRFSAMPFAREACEKRACDLLAGASVSRFEKRRPQPALKLANNLPADAADCEKAVHGGRYAIAAAFRQEFRRPQAVAATIWPRHRRGSPKGGRISARLTEDS